MTGPEERTGEDGGAARGDAWMSFQVLTELSAVSDGLLDALGDVIAKAGSEARRDAETRLATALEELDAARLEAEGCRLRIEEMAAERAILEAEIGSGMATMEASMKRIRSALVKAAVTPDREAAETTAQDTTATPRDARGGSRSDIGAATPAQPDADAPAANDGAEDPAPNPGHASDTARPLEKTRRTGRGSKEETWIGAVSVPPEVDAGIEAIVQAGEFADRRDAVVALLGEALAARASRNGTATGAVSGSGPNLETRPTADARPDAPRASLNGASHPTGGAAGRSGIP